MIDIKDHIITENPTVISLPEHQLVLKKIRLLSLRRITWLRKVWSEMMPGEDSVFTPHIEVDGYLQQIDDATLEKKWIEEDESIQPINDALRSADLTLATIKDSRWVLLANVFGINRRELDLLQTCFAQAIDPDLGRVFAYMQDHSGRAYVTEPLIAKLYGYGCQSWLRPASPLKVWGITGEIPSGAGEPARMEIDPSIKNWLMGYNGLDELLVPCAKYQAVKQPLDDWPVAGLVQSIEKIWKEDKPQPIRIMISATSGSGRKTFAAIVSQRLGFPLLCIDASQASENRRQQFFAIAQRYAFLTNSALLWYKLEMEKYQTYNIPVFPLQFFLEESADCWKYDQHFIDLRVTIPSLKYNERLLLWKKVVPQSAGWPQEALEEIVLRYQTSIGQITALGQRTDLTITEAYNALKAGYSHQLGKLAQLSNGDFNWDDLVVTDTLKTAIEDFRFEATARVQFWEQQAAQRLFPQGRSLIALFTGSPGTGKTMAAQVIAASLKLDLYRVDLSAVVSKYIGESSKNIERILSQAREMDIVLLFDEADALFGKRTEIKDAHDRYANTDTNYLLQAIEQYPGIVILSSNKKAGIDPAFMRRFRYVLDFPKPDKLQRLRLWQAVIQQLLGNKLAVALQNDLVSLSVLLELTGAQIKQAVLSAIFIAERAGATLDKTHLLRGVERELMKEGKSMGKEWQQQLNANNI